MKPRLYKSFHGNWYCITYPFNEHEPEAYWGGTPAEAYWNWYSARGRA